MLDVEWPSRCCIAARWAQLIKHALELRHAYADNFTLVYYWHYVPSEIGDLHRSELSEFAQAVHNDMNFVAVDVSELLSRLDPDRDTKPWFDYMVSRYLLLQ